MIVQACIPVLVCHFLHKNVVLPGLHCFTSDLCNLSISLRFKASFHALSRRVLVL